MPGDSRFRSAGRRGAQECIYQIGFRESIAPSYSKIGETGRSFLSDWEEAQYQVGEGKRSSSMTKERKAEEE